jgi:hypothetical protein
MSAATLLGVFLVPVLYVLVGRITRKKQPALEPSPAEHVIGGAA